jgi:hypothetical protein
MQSTSFNASLLIMGAALLLAACSPTFGRAPDREVIVVPQGTTIR